MHARCAAHGRAVYRVLTVTRSLTMHPAATAVCWAATMCVSTSVAAQPIPITNPSFEANVAAPNTFPVLVPQGWTLVDQFGIVDQSQDAVGVLHPSAAMGNTFFPAGAPDGLNVALIYLEGDIGDGPVGLQQQLAAMLQPHRYTLTVHVGNIASGFGPPNNRFYDLDGFPGYAVELRAGNMTIASDVDTLFGTFPDSEGEFRMSTVIATVAADHPMIGRPLSVHLINLNTAETPENPGIEVDFDDVHLLSEPMPCPADFNASAEVSVQDIFDFLTDWSSQSAGGSIILATADFNASGDVSVQDIFDFLTAWSSGCP
jgi:hapalindole H/12-epi-hapalindole U/12-epi-fischerindole U synthase